MTETPGPSNPADDEGADSSSEQAMAKNDCPCMRCGYNIRGLPRDADCPECGCPEATTLDMLEARTLCPNCLAPAHPSQTNCPHCGSPLSGSGSIAGMAAGQLHVPPRIGKEGQLRPAPLIPVILIWIFFAPFAVPTTLFWIVALREILAQRAFSALPMWLLMGLVVALLDLPLFLVTRAYTRRRKLPTGDEDDEDTAPPATDH